MKVVEMKLSDIRPADYNPRVKLVPGDTEYEALKDSIERWGLVDPLILNERTNTLVSGHQRLSVLKATGAETAEVVIIDVEEAQEKMLNVQLNKIEGDWDYEKLEELFGEIEEEDIKYTGFSEEELLDLFNKEDTDAAGAYEDEEEKEKAKDEENPAKPEKPFNIYISFASKEAAEAWLKERNIEAEFTGTQRNITIRMEGIEYGTVD